MKHHQTLRRGLCALLSLLLCLTLLPSGAMAAGNDTGSKPKAIQLGAGGLLSPSAETTGEGKYYSPQSYVYFGVNDNNAIKWRVLDASKANDDQTDGIFLLSEMALETLRFNQAYHAYNSEYHKGEAPL